MNQKLRPAKHAVSETLGGETVLLELDSGIYYTLNAVGSRIWSLIVAGHTTVQAAAELTREFDVSLEQATDDVSRLVAELEEHRLLEPDDA